MAELHSRSEIETMEEPKIGYRDEKEMVDSFYEKLNAGTDVSMEDCSHSKTYLDTSVSVTSNTSQTSVVSDKEPKRRRHGSLISALVKSLFDPIKTHGGLNEKDAAMAKALMDRNSPTEGLQYYELWTINLKKLRMSSAFARGAFGTIFLGRYKGEAVAIKVLKRPGDGGDGPEIARTLERQFRREVMSLANMSHPNVLRFIGACRKPTVWCIVTEYAKGGSVRDYLDNRQKNGYQNPMPLKLVIKRALDIAKGMEFIHSFGFIHRDLKSDNLLIGSDNSVKIADFGFARIEVKAERMTPFTGTFRYMAPEMIEGKPYTQKVDVYSFGIILWELVTCLLPYKGVTALEAANLVVNFGERPEIPDDCLPSLRKIMTSCWDKNPDVRPPFTEVIEMLHTAETEMMTTIRKARFRGSIPKPMMID